MACGRVVVARSRSVTEEKNISCVLWNLNRQGRRDYIFSNGRAPLLSRSPDWFSARTIGVFHFLLEQLVFYIYNTNKFTVTVIFDEARKNEYSRNQIPGIKPVRLPFLTRQGKQAQKLCGNPVT